MNSNKARPGGKTKGIFYFAAVLFLCSAGPASGVNKQIIIADSGLSHVQLLELYGSESCSSCPPAEAWISHLKDSPELWKSFVPVVFHVDYWNNLGWKDGLSSDAMTQRQISLAKNWPHESVYTPAFIIDGREWTNWSSAKVPPANASLKNNLRLKIYRKGEGSYLVISEGLAAKEHYIIRAALLGMGLEANITSGENTGRMLRHDFVILEWQAQDEKSDIKGATFRFKRPLRKTAQLAVVAWIERASSPSPAQATGAYLTNL